MKAFIRSKKDNLYRLLESDELDLVNVDDYLGDVVYDIGYSPNDKARYLVKLKPELSNYGWHDNSGFSYINKYILEKGCGYWWLSDENIYFRKTLEVE